MGKEIVLVGIGGMIGSILRFLISQIRLGGSEQAFPMQTFFVNVSGALVIGFIYSLTQKTAFISEPVRLLLMTGFCGGYTTFSTFSLENITLLKNGAYLLSVTYIVFSVLFSLAGVIAGMRLGTWFTK